MTDRDPTEIELLSAMARDERLTSSQRMRALETLQRLRPPEPEPTDALGAMESLVARLCPEPPELRGSPPDPMRDMDAAEQLGWRRDVDPAIWTWLPSCPPNVAQAEREVLQAMRRLGLGPGPLEPPGGAAEDELAAKRRRRG
jgi:hypothetical protein